MENHERRAEGVRAVARVACACHTVWDELLWDGRHQCPRLGLGSSVERAAVDTGGAVAASGSRFSFDAVEFSPQPAQNPSVPIWVGSRGVGRLPLRRAAQYGDYWHPVRVTPEELIDASNFIDDLAGRRVRRSARLVFGQAKPTEAVVEAIESYRAAGCEQVAIDFRCESLSIYLKLAEQLSMRLMLV